MTRRLARVSVELGSELCSARGMKNKVSAAFAAVVFFRCNFRVDCIYSDS